MAYVDYKFYQDEYAGKLIAEGEFSYYENKAEVLIKDMTFGKSDTYDGDEVKYATCAVAEQFYLSEGKSSLNASSLPLGISSERVGEYSVTYANNTSDARLNSALKSAKSCIKYYLGNSGLLYRGIDNV